jgi:hypothetical protein
LPPPAIELDGLGGGGYGGILAPLCLMAPLGKWKIWAEERNYDSV